MSACPFSSPFSSPSLPILFRVRSLPPRGPGPGPTKVPVLSSAGRCRGGRVGSPPRAAPPVREEGPDARTLRAARLRDARRDAVSVRRRPTDHAGRRARPPACPGPAPSADPDHGPDRARRFRRRDAPRRRGGAHRPPTHHGGRIRQVGVAPPPDPLAGRPLARLPDQPLQRRRRAAPPHARDRRHGDVRARRATGVLRRRPLARVHHRRLRGAAASRRPSRARPRRRSSACTTSSTAGPTRSRTSRRPPSPTTGAASSSSVRAARTRSTTASTSSSATSRRASTPRSATSPATPGPTTGRSWR